MLDLTSSSSRIELGVYRSPPKQHQATELLILAGLQWNCLSKFLHLPSLSSRSSANCQTFVDMHAYLIRIYYIYIHIERERRRERERERERASNILSVYTRILIQTRLYVYTSLNYPPQQGTLDTMPLCAMHKNTHTSTYCERTNLYIHLVSFGHIKRYKYETLVSIHTYTHTHIYVYNMDTYM